MVKFVILQMFRNVFFLPRFREAFIFKVETGSRSIFIPASSTLAPQIALWLLRLQRFFYVCGNLFRQKH